MEELIRNMNGTIGQIHEIVQRNETCNEIFCKEIERIHKRLDQIEAKLDKMDTSWLNETESEDDMATMTEEKEQPDEHMESHLHIEFTKEGEDSLTFEQEETLAEETIVEKVEAICKLGAGSETIEEHVQLPELAPKPRYIGLHSKNIEISSMISPDAEIEITEPCSPTQRTETVDKLNSETVDNDEPKRVEIADIKKMFEKTSAKHEKAVTTSATDPNEQPRLSQQQANAAHFKGIIQAESPRMKVKSEEDKFDLKHMVTPETKSTPPPHRKSSKIDSTETRFKCSVCESELPRELREDGVSVQCTERSCRHRNIVGRLEEGNKWMFTYCDKKFHCHQLPLQTKEHSIICPICECESKVRDADDWVALSS